MMALQPFAETGVPMRVMAGAQRLAGELRLRYTLQGDLASLRLPAHATTMARADRLWEATCFECFFAVVKGKEYWEVNLSPAGAWNVYAFADYRQGMREETAIQRLAVHCRGGDDFVTVSTVIPLPPTVANAGLAVGLSAVSKERAGETGYWALAHPAAQPDFHHRRGFVLSL
ncbi:DOMON-like domain-containing protein [Thermodesulfobacteriota bacterium]